MTPALVLYDPDCGFCRVVLALLLRWDSQGRLRPVALGTEEARALLEGMPDEQQMASWHLVEPGAGGRGPQAVHSAGAAFPPVFARLPGGRPLARLSERFPRASERLYRWVADNRRAFGRPLPEAARRWADGVVSGSRPDGR
jgi:predicted DCC family thiol-disulfide oxidoreductase YuxK